MLVFRGDGLFSYRDILYVQYTWLTHLVHNLLNPHLDI